jgi:DNA-binding SARP family transcriptional activator/tetratricopeptide (TPR) repeat protein
MAEVHLLGPVRLWVDGRAVDLGPAKQRTVLAALLVDGDQPVPTDTLMDRVWGDEPPASARSTLYSYVAGLRRVLREAVDSGDRPIRLEHGPGGYRLTVASHQVDLYRFRRLVRVARDGTHDDERRAAMLDEASSLWRGPALADLPGEWASRTREVLAHQRLDATLLWVRVQLRLDRPDRVIGPLREFIGEHPLVEPLTALLMEALLREGRSAEALACFGTTRRRLVDELGVEPGPELRQLHKAILGHDGDGQGEGSERAGRRHQGRRQTGVTPPDGEPTQAFVVPAQLPLDIHGFVGRADELARLDSFLADHTGQPTAVVVCTLNGGAGVGKTVLAVHWAHRVAAQFPGGQLFVDLRGFDPAGQAMTTAEAVRLLLDSLGVPPQRVPVSEQAQIGLYRSLLAGRRVLVVLDNAATAEQVRPLLPGSPGCLAVATSRNQLSGLGTEAAHPLTLDVLNPAEGRDLLAGRLGSARVAAEPGPVKEIIDLCAGLPLALAVVAARAAAQPRLRLSSFAAELNEGLDAFADTDPSADVRTVFSWSYRALSGAAARLFRLLGLHPGPDIDTAAAASLAGVSPSRVRQCITELVRAHLLTEPSAGRFAFHDLLRAYAAELVHTHDPEHRRRAALHRVFDHYVHGACAAARVMTPHRDPIDLAPPRPGVVLSQDLGDHAQALAWLTAQHLVLLASLRQAAQTGFHSHTWQLAWALATLMDYRGHWRELTEIHNLGLAAAVRLADRPGQAYAHRMLGRALTRLGDLGAARAQYENALGVSADTGDHLGQAHAHLGLGWVHEQRHELRTALGHVRHAGELYAGAGHLAGQASALNQAGWYHAQLGEYEEALVDCESALALQVKAGHRYGQASSWDSLGFANHQLGRYPQAARCYQRALQLHRDNGDRYREAATLVRSADCHHAAGDADAARRELTAAHAILKGLDHPDADGVRSKLAGLGAQPPGQGPRPSTAATWSS